MKNKTMKNLIVLGAVIFSLVLVGKVSAYYNPYDSSYWLTPVSDNSIEDYNGYNVYTSDNYSQNYYPYYASNQGYSPYYVSNQNSSSNTGSSDSTKVVNNYYYYQTAPASSTSSKANTSSTTKVVATNYDANKYDSNASSVKTYGTGYYNGGYSYGNGLGASAYDSYLNQQQGSRITALTWKGSGGFMPSSLWQWIVVVILILAIIIISRLIIHKRSLVVQEVHPSHIH